MVGGDGSDGYLYFLGVDGRRAGEPVVAESWSTMKMNAAMVPAALFRPADELLVPASVAQVELPSAHGVDCGGIFHCCRRFGGSTPAISAGAGLLSRGSRR